MFSFFAVCARAVLAQFDSGEIAFRRSLQLSTSDFIASLSIEPLVPFFLKIFAISLPLRSFFPSSTGASLPFVVSSRSSCSSCPFHSSFFSCSSRSFVYHFWLCVKNGQNSSLLSARRAACRDNRLWIYIVDCGYQWDFTYLRTVVQFTRCDVYDQSKIEQSGSANGIVATYSGVYLVDNPELCTCMHSLVATCPAKLPCVLPVLVP